LMEESGLFEVLLLARADLRDASVGVDVQRKIRSAMLLIDEVLDGIQRGELEFEEVPLYV